MFIMVFFVLVPSNGSWVLSLAMGSTMYQQLCTVDADGIKERGPAYADQVLEVKMLQISGAPRTASLCT